MTTKPEATKEEYADYLIKGFWDWLYDWPFEGERSWPADTVVTYSFEGNSGDWTEDQRAGIKYALDSWARVADLSFSPASGNEEGSIVFKADRPNSNDYVAAKNINVSFFGIGSEIQSAEIKFNVNEDSKFSYSLVDEKYIGGSTIQTVIHEIGHALGLGHGGPYNDDVFDGEEVLDDTPFFNQYAIFSNDTLQYSTLSYWNADNSGSGHDWFQGAGPLLFDIYAIQQKYGAAIAEPGNTRYGFFDNDEPDYANSLFLEFDFRHYKNNSRKPVVAIWDAGGADVLDLTGYSRPSFVSLEPGDFSSVDGLDDNIAIAYGTWIEDAFGGSGNDTISGNEKPNYLRGCLLYTSPSPRD